MNYCSRKFPRFRKDDLNITLASLNEDRRRGTRASASIMKCLPHAKYNVSVVVTRVIKLLHVEWASPVDVPHV